LRARTRREVLSASQLARNTLFAMEFSAGLSHATHEAYTRLSLVRALWIPRLSQSEWEMRNCRIDYRTPRACETENGYVRYRSVQSEGPKIRLRIER
jgi:hypothetical protein